MAGGKIEKYAAPEASGVSADAGCLAHEKIGADTRTQAEKFEAAARELGCDPDEDRFKDVLRKLAKPKS